MPSTKIWILPYLHRDTLHVEKLFITRNGWSKTACYKTYALYQHSSAPVVFLLRLHHRSFIPLCLRTLWPTRTNRSWSGNELHPRYLWVHIIIMVSEVLLLWWKAKVEAVMFMDSTIQWSWPIVILLHYISFRRVNRKFLISGDWIPWAHVITFKRRVHKVHG